MARRLQIEEYLVNFSSLTVYGGALDDKRTTAGRPNLRRLSHRWAIPTSAGRSSSSIADEAIPNVGSAHGRSLMITKIGGNMAIGWKRRHLPLDPASSHVAVHERGRALSISPTEPVPVPAAFDPNPSQINVTTEPPGEVRTEYHQQQIKFELLLTLYVVVVFEGAQYRRTGLH